MTTTMPASALTIITAIHALPIALLILFSLPLVQSRDGALLWLASLVPARRRTALPARQRAA